jgi:hypothetical protein
MTQSKTERLIQAQLTHILDQIQSADVINQEVDALINTLSQQPISKLISLDNIQSIAKQYILSQPIHEHLLEQVTSQIQFAIFHPQNAQFKLQQLIPDATIDNIADYLSTQKNHREALIHRIFSNPAYAQMLSQTISHAINDYMENNMLTKKMPGVGGLMKLGKSVIERATDSNLDDALQGYLNKNINNLIAVSEKMANRHLNDQQVHQLIMQGWKSIRKQPISVVQKFVTTENINEVATVVSQTWEHLRQTDYIQTQINDGIAHWYDQHQHTPLATLMKDVNVDSAGIQQEVKNIVMPIIQQLISDGYIAARVEVLLRQFFESDVVSAILAE